MVQNMIGGSTSYEEQSLPDILRDIENWIDYAIELKPLIIKNKEDLIKNKFWYKISYEFQRTIDSTILYLNTILHDLDIVKNAISNSRITVKDVELLNNIGKKSIEYNDVYAVSFKESDHWHDYENPDFNSAQEIYKNGRDFFVMLQDADNAAARLGDYIQVGNNTITINGDIKDSQIQQGTYNSSQNMTVSNGFDYKQVLGIITEIQKIVNKYDLVEEFGDNTEQLRLIVKETVEMVEKKEEPLKIKTALKTIRDLAVGVTGSVIATGICTLISQLLI